MPELTWNDKTVEHYRRVEQEDDLKAVRGIAIGLALGAVVWATIGAVAWLLLR